VSRKRAPAGEIPDTLFVNSAKAAAILRRDERTVRRAIVFGEIPATKVGRSWCIPVAWLREQAKAGAL